MTLTTKLRGKQMRSILQTIVMIALLICGNMILAAQDYETWKKTANEQLINYGNWCSLENDIIDTSQFAVDALDNACKTHSLCIYTRGYHECECDNEFLNALKIGLLSNDREGIKYQSIALATYSQKPCEFRIYQKDGTLETIPGLGGDAIVVDITEWSPELEGIVEAKISQSRLNSLGRPGDYGKWCGARNSGPGDPVDGVDNACMHHDKCYKEKGNYRCSCDADFLKRLRKASARDEAGETYKIISIGFFLQQRCRCRVKTCIGWAVKCRGVKCKVVCVKYASADVWGRGGVCGAV